MLVWKTASSYSLAKGRTSWTERPRAGASTSRLPGTSAAGCASHVGYQNERISRLAWYRDPAPPSNPSYDGGFKNNVFLMALLWSSPFSFDAASGNNDELLVLPHQAATEEADDTHREG